MPTPLSDAEKRKIRKLHADGMSCNKISKALGRNTSTIAAYCRKEGLTFQRSNAVIAMNRAQSIDYAARRNKIIDRAYSQMEAILDRLEAAEWHTVMRGEGGAEHESSLAFIPADDLKAVHGALSQMTTTALRLEAVDGTGAQQVANLLTGLADQLGVHDG